LFCGTVEHQAALDALSKDDLAERYAEVGRWFAPPLLHAIRGRLLHELGDQEQARAAELRAAELTANRAEQSLLRRRIAARAP
jgi:RNA polymerase sigma-70 factor (ECF subfamily)